MLNNNKKVNLRETNFYGTHLIFSVGLGAFHNEDRTDVAREIISKIGSVSIALNYVEILKLVLIT